MQQDIPSKNIYKDSKLQKDNISTKYMNIFKNRKVNIEDSDKKVIINNNRRITNNITINSSSLAQKSFRQTNKNEEGGLLDIDENLEVKISVNKNDPDRDTNRVILIGEKEIAEPLSKIFAKKKKLKQNRENKEGSSRKRKTSKSSTNNKFELRQKMIDYGKKTIQDTLKKSADDESFSQFCSNIDSIKMTGKKAKALERMSRGQKPKITKSEIKQITQRNLQRFNGKTTFSSSILQDNALRKVLMAKIKKDDLLIRKNKVKEMDKKIRKRLLSRH